MLEPGRPAARWAPSRSGGPVGARTSSPSTWWHHAKLCVLERDQPLITHALEVDRVYRLRPGSGLPVRAPVIDMIEIGTGGGFGSPG